METFLHDLSWVLPLRSDTNTQIFTALSALGYTPFFLVMLPLGYWLWDKAMFTRVAMLIGFVALTNSFLKDLFQDPRPPLALALDGRVGESFGFPSGHAQVAVALWLWLAYEVKRAWAWGLAILIAAGVCFSRLYLGVHDVEDVLGGALLGLASVALFVNNEAWSRLNPAVYLLVIAAIVPLLMFAWPKAPTPAPLYGLVGFLFAWWIGHIAQRSTIHYERHPNWLMAGAATILGLGGVYAITKYAGVALADTDPRLAQMLQFAIVSLFVTAVAPVMFRRLRLARA